jgi:phage/plasmid primase, P4 family, C-terminal domain
MPPNRTTVFRTNLSLSEIAEFVKRGEVGDAELFAHQYKDQVVFDHSTDDWYIFRGAYWEKDAKREIIRYVGNRLAAIYLYAAGDERNANGESELYEMLTGRAADLHKIIRIKHVLELAASEPGITMSGSEWDICPDLLPVNNGVVELKTGIMRTSSPTEYIRRHSSVDWMGLDAPAPLWEKTVIEIFDCNSDMVSFIHRLFGYATCGYITEHKLPIFLGEEARNGKTTIFETLNKVLGNEFCASIPVKVLMKGSFDSDGNSPEPYIASLRGKRLVYASESAKGMKLNSALVKKLTGGDQLNARGLYETPTAFDPTHKIMLFTNDKPIVPPEDQGIWERIMLIELKISFVDNPDPQKPNQHAVDKSIGEKLKPEYPGILAWLVRGFMKWQEQGLNPPAEVVDATNQYRESEDLLAEYIKHGCTVGDPLLYQVRVMDIFTHHRSWCSKYGMTALDLKEFKQQMKRKFGDPKKKNNGWFYLGLELKP